MQNPPSEYDTGPPTERVMMYKGRNSRYFKLAKKVAICSQNTDYKHGAVLVKGGSVLNTCCNKNRLVSFASRFCTEHDGTSTLHAELGAKMLEGAEQFPVLKAGHIIALEHHEKWDGSGYPNGKKGEEIHLYARIIAIADVFDALSSKRVYKDPMSLEKVLEIMKSDAGTHFDPNLIELFLNNLDQFLEIKEKYQDDDSAHTIMDIIKGINN